MRGGKGERGVGGDARPELLVIGVFQRLAGSERVRLAGEGGRGPVEEFAEQTCHRRRYPRAATQKGNDLAVGRNAVLMGSPWLLHRCAATGNPNPVPTGGRSHAGFRWNARGRCDQADGTGRSFSETRSLAGLFGSVGSKHKLD